MKFLSINNIKINVGKKEIVHGVSVVINPGEVHVIMGPNGSGKSTLANAIMGHPKYTQTGGKLILDGEDISLLKTDEKARRGLFLSMQYVPEIAGVTLTNFLRTSFESTSGKKQNPLKFYEALKKRMEELGIDPTLANRHLNVGFSGGEKKRMEILHLLTFEPKYAILDETDSGLDVDALRFVADGINKFKSSQNAVLLITHYNRILKYIKPDVIHIMVGGRIVKSGGAELADEIEDKGYIKYLG